MDSHFMNQKSNIKYSSVVLPQRAPEILTSVAPDLSWDLNEILRDGRGRFGLSNNVREIFL